MKTQPLHALSVFALSFACAAAPARDIATLADFSAAPPLDKPYVSWRWTPETKAQAERFSRLAVEPSPDGEGNVWRLTLTDAFPWGTLPEYIQSITRAHFPPEADAIVLRCRVLDGTFTLAFGGPTAYFGNSDVTTAYQTLSPGGWQDVVFDLNHDLIRNYRRAGFSRHARSIAYTRWAQEPPGLYLMRSQGTLLVRDIRLVARGEGRPFPAVAPDEATVVAGVPIDEASALTCFMPDGRNQIADFHASWKAGQSPSYAPPRLSFAATPGHGRSLAATARWSEEVRWMGVRTPAVRGANAIRLGVRLVTEQESAVAGHPEVDHPVDIGLLSVPPDGAFPFDRLSAPEAERDAGVRGHDLLYAHLTLADADWPSAFHTTRRFVRQGVWTTLVVPFADFVCIGATGGMRGDLETRAAPGGDGVRAVLALMPYPRGRSFESTLELGDIDFVRIPDEQARASYHRPAPGPLVPVPGLSGYGGYVQGSGRQP